MIAPDVGEYSLGTYQPPPDVSIEQGECCCSLIDTCRLCQHADGRVYAGDGSEPRSCGHGPGGTCELGHCYDCDACYCGEDY